jgi:hypothetical protein
MMAKAPRDMSRRAAIAALGVLTLAAAGCQRKEPARGPQPSQASAAEPSERAMPVPSAVTAGTQAALDTGVLEERRDPDRLLRFYAAALRMRDWSAAAKAWGAGSGVTAKTLKASYDRPEPPILELGKGEAEGAAGSLYYEVPVTLRFGTGAPPERGSLVLRRVNSIDDARPGQLRWHIERSTIGQGD